MDCGCRSKWNRDEKARDHTTNETEIHDIITGKKAWHGPKMRLFGFLFTFAVICNSLKNPDGAKYKKFMKPCFVGDEIENMCSEPSESCHEKQGTQFKLVRLDGIKVNIILF